MWQQVYRCIQFVQLGAANIAIGKVVLNAGSVFRLQDTQRCLGKMFHAEQAIVLQ